LVSGKRQVTSQCAFGQLSVVHSWPDRRRTDRHRQNNSLSVYYVYLKVTKGNNSISSWCSATKLGVSHPHMQVHIPVK